MNVCLPAAARPHLGLKPGHLVHVNHGPAWLAGIVTSVTARHVGVLYTAPGGRAEHTQAAPWLVRIAHRARLAAVGGLRRGDRVITGDGRRLTVTGPPALSQSGWWQVSFTDGSTADAHPRAIWRLAEVSSRLPALLPAGG